MSGGLISRNAIAKELDIHGIVRTPEVEAVFAAADRRFGHRVGSSSKYDILAPELERALSNGEVGLRNGRPTHVWAASQLGVSTAAIRHSHVLKRLLDAYKPAETTKEDVRSIPSISWERSQLASGRVSPCHPKVKMPQVMAKRLEVTDLLPRKWTGLSRSAFGLGGADIAQSRVQAA